ncbi:MAG: hypothetical protein H6621_12665 [Halobacteriovoraceae bacterium]|nr:hypothetical protein [Halobacteriovoraceae bacterium]MCB9095913.1 hypothetical protein [Halobacteriovoraceae bacterium]
MNNVSNIFPISHKNCVYHDAEVQDIVNLLNTISKKSYLKVNECKSRLKCLKNNDPKAIILQENINSTLQKWSEHTKRIGVVPLGVFRCKIATEDNTYIWEYPNKKADLL